MPGTYIPSHYVSILIILIFATLVGLTPLLVGILIRPKRPYGIKLSPYESGNPPVGDTRQKFSVKFYIIAMLFMVFDVEAVFLYPWAVAYDVIGLYGFIEMMIFIFILIVGYVYAWGKGALEWE
jgi:NADH-quinone oxidoreductase subunit A